MLSYFAEQEVHPLGPEAQEDPRHPQGLDHPRSLFEDQKGGADS